MSDVEEQSLSLANGPLLRFFSPDDFGGTLSDARYMEIDTYVRTSIASPLTARIKVWDDQGRVVYSTDKSQVGQQFEVKEQLAAALAGGVGRKLSVPKDAENERERMLGTLIEVYVPLQFPGDPRPRGSFEVYQYYAPVAKRIGSLQNLVYWTLGIGFVVIYLGLLGVVWGGWRTITRQRATIEASERQLRALNTSLQTQVNTLFNSIASAVTEAKQFRGPMNLQGLGRQYNAFVDQVSQLVNR